MKIRSAKEYDRLLQIQTMSIAEQPTENIHYHHYEATPYRLLDLFFTHYPLKKKDRFVDVGCGKGRVLFYVHHYFSCTVTGIEKNEQLYRMAIDNEMKYRQNTKMRKKGSIWMECCVAETYEIKEDENRFFFFNPFSLKIFRKVIHNILRSIQQVEREVDVILYYPDVEYIDFLETETSFELFQEVKVPSLSTINPRESFQVWRYKMKDE